MDLGNNGLLDSNDVTQGEEAHRAFLQMLRAGRGRDIEFWSAHEVDTGEPLVLIDDEAEIVAMSVQQALAAALLLTRTAARFPKSPSADVLLDVSELLGAVVADLVGSGGEMVH